jgi:hypothetical protein
MGNRNASAVYSVAGFHIYWHTRKATSIEADVEIAELFEAKRILWPP